MFKRGKRGISPLIATVLLIAFAVSIGTMLINWAPKGGAEAGDCTDVGLEVQPINGMPLFCYDVQNTMIRAMMKNTGSVDIAKLQLLVTASDFTVDQKDLDNSGLKVNTVANENVNYVKSGKFKVEFLPVINVAGKEKVCFNRSVEIDEIPACN